jgi:predicted nucleotidyltransferase
MKIHGIDFSIEYLSELAGKWQIRELALFGSVLTDDFRDDSDLDFLITFNDSAEISLFELNAIRDELSTHFGRRVDLVEKRAIRNPYRRSAILTANQVLIEA